MRQILSIILLAVIFVIFVSGCTIENINKSNIDEDFVGNIPSSEIFSETYAYATYSYASDYEDIIDLSCLKDTNIKCGEKELDMKKAVDIAVFSSYADNIPKGTIISEIRFIDVVCNEGTEDEYCNDNFKYTYYMIWINGPIDDSLQSCYEQTVVTINKETWNIIDSETNQKCKLNEL